MTPKTKLVLNVLSILIGLVWVWIWVVPPQGLRDNLRLIVGVGFIAVGAFRLVRDSRRNRT